MRFGLRKPASHRGELSVAIFLEREHAVTILIEFAVLLLVRVPLPVKTHVASDIRKTIRCFWKILGDS